MVSTVSRCMNARDFGMSTASTRCAAPAENSRWASISTAGGWVRSLIPTSTEPLPSTRTSPPSMVAGALSAPLYQISNPAPANIGCHRYIASSLIVSRIRARRRITFTDTPP